MNERDTHDDWALRPWITAGAGAAAGLIAHWLIDGHRPNAENSATIATAVFVSALATLFAFTFEVKRYRWALIFSGVTAAVVALIVYWNGAPGHWSVNEGWRAVCVALSVAIAAPLFQAARDEGRAHFPYVAVHRHAWTNVVIWCASWAFAGIVFLLAFLLSELFGLIGIRTIQQLLRHEWFQFLLFGAAFGGAAGLFRERDRVVGLLQRVVVSVLAVLAPVLGAGLLVFLVSLPFTGLTPLWEATKSTTPILLSCVIGALILSNAVIANGDEEESRFVPLRYGAMALGLAMLPFALIAAVSTGTRIAQYGLTPDRAWALTFIIVACAYGLAYLVALVRRRRNWGAAVRPANLTLGFALCGLALLLATPLLSFNALSARDQVARLTSGRTPATKFDWAALSFDFGAPGKAATERLAKSHDPAIRKAAASALKAQTRWDATNEQQQVQNRAFIAPRLRVVPARVPLPPGLLEAFDLNSPDSDAYYALYYVPGGREAFLIGNSCKGCTPNVRRATLDAKDRWTDSYAPYLPVKAPAVQDTARAIQSGKVELRDVRRRQIFVDGKPAGIAFE